MTRERRLACQGLFRASKLIGVLTCLARQLLVVVGAPGGEKQQKEGWLVLNVTVLKAGRMGTDGTAGFANRRVLTDAVS